MTVRVSVVVPTYRRPDLLARCLDTLAGQDLAAADYEVIIADDAASEATQRQVADAASRMKCAVYYAAVRATQGPAGARNVGWRLARGPVIAFTDDDCLPEPGWLAAGLAAFEANPDLVAVTGRVIVPLPPAPTDYEVDASGLERSEFVTANCFCRRDMLEKLGGFDERFTAAWREDSDLHFRLLDQGALVVRAPGAVVIHPVRPAAWGVSLKQQRKSCFEALLYAKHPDRYRRHIQACPPWGYYGMLAALLAVAVGLAFGPAWLAAAAAVVWLVLTGQFFWKRMRHTSRAPVHVAEMLVTSAVIPPLSIYWRLRGALRYRVPFL